MTNQEKEQLWQEKIAAYRQSGKSATEWCSENQVSIHTLRAWINRFNKKQVAESIKAKSTATQPAKREPCKEQHATEAFSLKHGKFRIEAEPGYDRVMLLDLLAVLLREN